MFVVSVVAGINCLCSSLSDEASIKFRPKQPLKMTKAISRPSVATKPNPANLDPSIHSTDLNPGSQVSHVRQEPVFPEKASHIESQVIEIDVNLQTNPNHTEVEVKVLVYIAFLIYQILRMSICCLFLFLHLRYH